MNSKVTEKEIGQRINRALGKRNMTQKELAEKVGVSEKSISAYVNGIKGCPSGKRIREFAIALDVSADYLLGLVPDDVLSKDFDVKQTAINLHLSEETVNSLMNREYSEIPLFDLINVLASHTGNDSASKLLNAITDRYSSFIEMKEWEKVKSKYEQIEELNKYIESMGKKFMERFHGTDNSAKNDKIFDFAEELYQQSKNSYDLAELHISRYAVDLADELIPILCKYLD